jgi:hypothetical protein
VKAPLKIITILGLAMSFSSLALLAQSQNPSTGTSIKIFPANPQNTGIPQNVVEARNKMMQARSQLMRFGKGHPPAPLSAHETMQRANEIYQAMHQVGLGNGQALPLCSPCSGPVTVTPQNPIGTLGASQVSFLFASAGIVDFVDNLAGFETSDVLGCMPFIIFGLQPHPATPVLIDLSIGTTPPNAAFDVSENSFYGTTSVMDGHLLILTSPGDDDITIEGSSGVITYTLYSATFTQM